MRDESGKSFVMKRAIFFAIKFYFLFSYFYCYLCLYVCLFSSCGSKWRCACFCFKKEEERMENEKETRGKHLKRRSERQTQEKRVTDVSVNRTLKIPKREPEFESSLGGNMKDSTRTVCVKGKRWWGENKPLEGGLGFSKTNGPASIIKHQTPICKIYEGHILLDGYISLVVFRCCWYFFQVVCLHLFNGFFPLSFLLCNKIKCMTNTFTTDMQDRATSLM